LHDATPENRADANFGVWMLYLFARNHREKQANRIPVYAATRYGTGKQRGQREIELIKKEVFLPRVPWQKTLHKTQFNLKRYTPQKETYHKLTLNPNTACCM